VIFLLVAFLAFVAGVLYFFWPSFTSPYLLLSGDAGDGRLLNAIAEHWYLVFRGSSAWRDMEMYYPQRGVLGYGDALILFAPPYIAQRLAGVPFLYAYVGTLVVILGTGYAATIWLLRRVVGVGTPIAVVGALMFTFSNMNMLKLGHTQLYAAAFVPLVFGLSWRATARLSGGGDFRRVATATAILLPLLLFTSFYVGWYTCLFVATWGLSLLATKALLDPGAPKALVLRAYDRRFALMGLSLVFAVALLPFILTYLPVLRDVGGRNWDEVKLSLPSVVDLINVGPNNYAWGWLTRYLVPPNRPLAHEQWLGLPLLLMTLFMATQVWLTGRVVRSVRFGDAMSNRDQAIFALGIATFVSWALMVEVGSVSLWKIVFRLLPGGGAIRAVFRYQVVLHLVVIVIVAVGLDRVYRLQKFRALVVIALVALLAEQLTDRRSRFNVRETTQRLAALPSPPLECRYFLIEKERDADNRPAFHLQMEAIVIAQNTGVPTINGYSANLPPHWGPALMDVRAPGYADAALTWLSHNDLREGLCLLDLQSGTWRMPQPRWSDPRGSNLMRRIIRDFEEGMAVSLKGFYPIETDGRWTNGSGQLLFAMPVDVRELHVRGIVMNALSQVRISVDGRPLYDQPHGTGPFRVDLSHTGRVSTIDISSSSFVPRALGMNNDTRLLGVMIESVVVD
jgi:hypothetical protein